MDENAWLIDYTNRDPASLWKDQQGKYRETLDGLTEAQRAYLLVWGFEGEVINGGFEQFIGNSTGETAELVPNALRKIGAHTCAALLHRVLRSVSPDPLPADSERRNELLGSRFHSIYPLLKESNRAFYDEPDDLTHLLYTFIHTHPADFGLPISELPWDQALP